MTAKNAKNSIGTVWRTTKDYFVVAEYRPITPYKAIVTHYTPYEGYSNLIMASGRKVYEGAIACPRAIPLNTKLKVGEKIYTCEDRTNSRYNGRYDIFTWDYDEAIQIGKQELYIEKSL